MKELTGYVNGLGQPRVRVTIIGDREKIEVDAIIDTGFDGDICIPVQLAVRLGLELRSVTWVELANGEKKRELVFTGSTIFGNAKRDVDIILTESKEVLIGTNMLSGHILEINFTDKSVKIR